MQKEHVKMLADLQKNLKRFERLENPFKPDQNLTKMFRKAIQDTSVQQNSRCNDVSCCCVQSKIAKIRQGVKNATILEGK
jgi:hypothetical protein